MMIRKFQIKLFVFILFFVVCVFIPMAEAQELDPMGYVNTEIRVHTQMKKTELSLHTSEILIPKINEGPFISFVLRVKGMKAVDHSKISLQIIESGIEGTLDSNYLSIDPHHENEEEFNYTSPYYFEKDISSFKIVIKGMTKDLFDQLGFQGHFFNPGFSKVSENQNSDLSDLRNDDCPEPLYLTREAWGPNCTIDPTVEYTTPSHLIVHHSAGSNSSGDWPAVVRSIWDYHVNVRGWDDIGYNWLIDPEGSLYIGRADNVRGAHFCGFNTNTMGCCMMGTYTSTLPSEESRNTLIGLLAWKAEQMEIDPLSSSYHSSSALVLDHIAGHRQGCSTECPGSQFFASFSSLRNEVQAFLDEECTEEIVLPLEISIQPNPNHGFFTFENPFDESLDLFIYSMDGKLVYKKQIPALSESLIKFQQRSSGIYHAIAIGASIKWEERVVVH